jgi:hypothetical protein
MKSKMDRYKSNESNAWALIYDQCSAELKNKLKGMHLNYPEKPKKTDAACCDANGDPDPDMFEMDVFA